MRSSVAVAALFAGAAIAYPNDPVDYYPAEQSSSSSVSKSSSITVAPVPASSSTPVIEYYPSESGSSSVPPVVHPVQTTKATVVHTVTACPSEKKDCPLKHSSTPVIVHPVPTSSKSSTYTSAPLVTSVVYATEIRTITACPPTVTHCPANKYETVTIPLYTTICPASETPYVHPSPTKIPVAPVAPSSYKASPTSQAPVHYYPSNGPVSPVKPTGTSVPTGYYTPKPSQFTGAASHLNAGAMVAGFGAFVALFI